jgi:hypothetical protein
MVLQAIPREGFQAGRRMVGDPPSCVLQPVQNHNPWMLLYFISFLLIVSFFVLNMFVGVVVENFHKCRQHQEAEEARRREEKRLRRLERRRRSKAVPEVEGRYLNACRVAPSSGPAAPSPDGSACGHRAWGPGLGRGADRSEPLGCLVATGCRVTP